MFELRNHHFLIRETGLTDDDDDDKPAGMCHKCDRLVYGDMASGVYSNIKIVMEHFS